LPDGFATAGRDGFLCASLRCGARASFLAVALFAAVSAEGFLLNSFPASAFKNFNAMIGFT